MQKAFLAIAAVLSTINVALFVFWFSLISVEKIQPDRDSEYILSALSLQIAFLEVVLAVVGIVIAVLAFVGYSAVKDAAVNKAQEETQKQIQTHLNKLKSLDVMDVSRSNNAPVDEVEAGDVKSEEQI